MSQNPLIHNYVSEIDCLLQQFDSSHSNLSKSQQKEQAKYRRIYQLRDDASAQSQKKPQSLWDGF